MASAQLLALANTDILYEVFEHLSLFPSSVKEFMTSNLGFDSLRQDKRKLQALASAALTCRAFAEPASRVLWAVLPDGILPILSTKSRSTCVYIYRTLFSHHSYPVALLEQEIVGDISVVEWARFDELASRVRCVVYGSGAIVIEPSVLELVVARCTSGRLSPVPLLPNLQVLAWIESLGDPSMQKLLRALSSSPRLSSFSICQARRQRLNPHVKEDIDIVAATCATSLQHFRSDRLLTHADVALARMQNLISVRVSYVDPSLFWALGSLPQLADLECMVRGPEQLDNYRCGPPAPPQYSKFPSLRSFRTARTAYHVPPTTALAMIAPISSAYLTSLSFEISVSDVTDIAPCLERISFIPAVQSLRKLDVHIRHPAVSFGDGGLETLVFRDVAWRLRQVRSLEDLSIHAEHRIVPLSDADVDQTLQWWPQIRRLSVSFDAHVNLHRRGISVQRPSLRRLTLAAETHHALEHLNVEVADVLKEELEWLEAREMTRGGDTDTSRLQSIAFARSHYRRYIRLPDIARLAVALRALFPMLGSGLGEPIDWTWSPDGERPLHHGWSGTDMDTKVFQLLQRLGM